MKFYLITNPVRIICFLVILATIIMGCEQTKSPFLKQTEQIESNSISDENKKLNTPEPNKGTALEPSSNVNKDSTNSLEPLQEKQILMFETGKPKEEPNVPDGGHSVNISTLKPIYNVGKGEVAITIDDGPTKNTNELLRVLKVNDVKVTFFFVGQNAATYSQSVLDAVYLGHTIGYHSNSHPKMTDMNLEGQEKEFEVGLSKLLKVEHEPVMLFRPPYGAYNNDTKVVTEKYKMSMVLWNEDPRDWSTTDPDLVAEHVLSQVQSGSIIVLHDRPSTISALPAIIKGIRKKGLKLVTIKSAL